MLGLSNTTSNYAEQALQRRASKNCSTLSVSCSRRHSQITFTVQPSSFKRVWFRASLATFPFSFCSQYARFEDGLLVFGQPCWCQKQPCTKITTPYLVNTRSGVPGSVLTCNL